jgi:hypothetical protein
MGGRTDLFYFSSKKVPASKWMNFPSLYGHDITIFKIATILTIDLAEVDFLIFLFNSTKL